MQKGKLKAVIGVVLVSSLTVSVFADSAIKLVFNGQELKSDVPPKAEAGRVMVPIRAISEALGAKVTWDKETNSVIIDSKGIEAQKLQIELMEKALSPQNHITAAQSWAEGMKMRNGAWQYALMAPELKKANYDNFVDLNWSTGVSSPWIASYKATEKAMIDNNTYRYEIEYTYTDSTKSTFTTKEYVTIKNLNGSWLITALEKVEAKGQITKITLGEDKKIKSIFIEDKVVSQGSYDKANVIIGADTKIYKGYTNEEIAVANLKEGTTVEVSFKEGPRTMIYPVSAEAKTIRVIQ